MVAALISVGLVQSACAQAKPAPNAVRAVATPNNLAALIASAQPGQTISLAEGRYGPLAIRGRQFAAPGIVIQPKPGASVVFPAIEIAQSQGVQIKGVEVDIDAPQYGVAVLNSSRVTLSGLQVHAKLAGGPSAMMVRQSRDVTVSDCEVHDVSFGINMLESDQLKILRNRFHDLQVDAIRGAVSNSEIIGNHATSFHPKPGDHPDFVQVWGRKSGPSQSNVIKDNVYERGDGEVAQGIFIEDNEDLEISGNALLGPMYNGIGLARVNRARVAGNFVQGFQDMGARIITRGKSQDVLVRDNVAQSIVTYNDGGAPNPGYREERNKVIRPAKVGDSSALQAWLARRGAQ